MSKRMLILIMALVMVSTLWASITFTGSRCRRESTEPRITKPFHHSERRTHIHSIKEKTRNVNGTPKMHDVRREPPRTHIRTIEEVIREPSTIEEKCVDPE